MRGDDRKVVYTGFGRCGGLRGHRPGEGDRCLDENCVTGYFTIGRLFANGFLKALLAGSFR